tara:strand:- start:2754 stop:3392 length:639 start_codon:yes stop_codon:yes gene_type:complete
MLRLIAALVLSASPVLSRWTDDVKISPDTPPPYNPPVDWTYTTTAAPAGIDATKFNVHLVPHTHDDTGWQITVDQYFYRNVYYIIDTVVTRLQDDPNRRFIYVEVGFFARWWETQPKAKQAIVKDLVARGQLEFINGGWCMHDEASPFYVEMVDQTTRGHQFLKKHFGDSAIPRATWQVLTRSVVRWIVSLLASLLRLPSFLLFLSLSLSTS